MRAKLTAEVIEVFEPRTGKRSDGTVWTMQDVLVKTTHEDYPKNVLMHFREMPVIEVGAEYEFHYEITAREYNGRWYNDVTCFRHQLTLESDRKEEPKPEPQQKAQQGDNELPF